MAVVAEAGAAAARRAHRRARSEERRTGHPPHPRHHRARQADHADGDAFDAPGREPRRPDRDDAQGTGPARPAGKRARPCAAGGPARPVRGRAPPRAARRVGRRDADAELRLTQNDAALQQRLHLRFDFCVPFFVFLLLPVPDVLRNVVRRREVDRAVPVTRRACERADDAMSPAM